LDHRLGYAVLARCRGRLSGHHPRKRV